MSRRVTTLVLSLLLVVGLLVAGANVHVPYAGLAPGPTYNTLGAIGGQQLIQISGRQTYPTSGHLNLVTVSVSGGPHYPMSLGKALQFLFDKHVDLVPETEIFPPGQTSQQVQQQDTQQMKESQSSATIAALGELGIAPTGTQVFSTTSGLPAYGKLKPYDQIVSVDGHPATTEDAVQKLIQGHKIGDQVTVGVTRGGRPFSYTLTTASSGGSSPHPIIGVELQPSWPFTVSINLNSVGGPSAGMMFALGIIDKLTQGDLTGGKFIAGTGEIEDNGKVDPIGGITQKMYGVRAAGAQYFLAPKSNCADVRSGGVPKGLQVIEVSTLHEALTDVKAIAAGNASTLPGC